jgi:undecaprenyl-diphosphatase
VPELSYLQAVVIGGLQGVTELFPVSSLGHSVLVPALVGGSWSHLVTEGAAQDSEHSPYLAFIVALHVATALALLVFYWRDWVRIVGAFIRTLRTRRIETSTERLAWLLVVATIPVGITGLALEHTFRVLFAKPLYAAVFLTINGLILLAGERLRRRAELRGQLPTGAAPAAAAGGATAATVGTRTTRTARTGSRARRLDSLAFREAAVIGLFQTTALFAGISRSGVTMVAGLLRGLDHEDAARFAFLLATPVILAAGVLKLPALAGSAGTGIRGQVLVGAVAAAVAAYLSVRFLTRYFTTRTLTPFAVYCLVVGVACIVRFA